MTTLVSEASHVTLHFQLLAQIDGVAREVASTIGGRPVTVQLGQGYFAEPLERRLVGLELHAERTFDLAPDEAYGRRNPDLVQTLARSLFDRERNADERVAPGDVVEFNAPDGRRVVGILKQIDAERVVVDFNHPLAGVPLQWFVRVLGVL